MPWENALRSSAKARLAAAAGCGCGCDGETASAGLGSSPRAPGGSRRGSSLGLASWSCSGSVDTASGGAASGSVDFGKRNFRKRDHGGAA